MKFLILLGILISLPSFAAIPPEAKPVMVLDASGSGINSTSNALNVSSAQSGTWTVQPGNTANTTAWKVDGSAVTQPISAASLPLPTGAATAAKQPALGTAGTPSADVITVQGITSMTALKVDGSAVTQPVSVAAAISTKSPVNTNGSTISNSSITTTASTITAPANTIGFIIEAESGNTANIRFAIGVTATASVGMLLEPGRDSGFIPAFTNLSVISISGTQTVSVIWVLSQ